MLQIFMCKTDPLRAWMADWASEKKQKYFTRLEELKSVGKPLHFGFLVFHLVCVNFLYVGVDPV